MSTEQLSRTAATLLDALARSLRPDQVLTRPEEIARYAGFRWLRPRRAVAGPYHLGSPAGVVRPRSTEDVAVVLREASAARVPIVPYGGGTGVMGGALPLAGGIVLDLGALNRIVAIEPENRLARVEAGVILGDLARAAEERGLLFAHDPWSQPIATVGGAIGTNGVGYLAAGYGAMGQQVLGLEVVLATGEVVCWPGAAKTSTGPELWRLFVGAEGTLGVITSAVIQLFPWPEERALAAFRFPTFADGFRAIERLGAVGLRPAMVDYEEGDGPPLQTPANLHLAFDGPGEVVQAALRRASAIAREHGGTNRGRAVAARFWANRHASADWYRQYVARAGALGRAALAKEEDRTELRYVDVAVPAARTLDYCAAVVAIAAAHAVAVHSFGLWARPDLVSYILEGPAGPLDRTLDAALRLARREGGSIEYCHGVGIRLAHLLPDELGSAYRLLQQIKATLDPNGILNPGKLGLPA